MAKKQNTEGVVNVRLTDEQIKEIALGVSENGAKFYAEKYGVALSLIRSAIASLRKAGLVVNLPARKGQYGRYKAIVAALKA